MRVGPRHHIDQLQNPFPDFGVFNLGEGLHQMNALCGGHEFGDIACGQTLSEPVIGRDRAVMKRCPFKEKFDRHIQHDPDLLQPTGADAVCPLLVFLNLLEGQTDGIAQALLTHAEHDAAHSDTGPDILVDGVGGSFMGWCFARSGAV